MGNTAAGWYDDGSGRQRWWDGQQWGPYADAQPGPPPRTAGSGASPPAGLAIAALIVGIVAFLAGWVPIVGAIIGLAGLALGIIALIKKQRKGLAITGLVLSGLAIIASIAVTAGIASFIPSADSRPDPVPSSSASESPEPSTEPTQEPTEEDVPPAPTTPDLSTFTETDDRTFALMAKDPDAHAGTNVIIYGSIMQFDSATGRCAMLIDTAATLKEFSYEYDQSVMAISGDAEATCPVFDPLVEDDHVKIWATVQQSFSYDTQIGGNTTVPMIEVWQAELLPATEY